MLLSTQAYLIRDGKWLMLLRNKKKVDVNKGKWIGVGGKFEPGETSEQCVKREVFEETGFVCGQMDLQGILYFYYEGEDSEKIYVYSCSDFSGDQIECNEGTLAWIPEQEIMDLNLWEGDRIFLEAMLNGKGIPFDLSLYYDNAGNLKRHEFGNSAEKDVSGS